MNLKTEVRNKKNPVSIFLRRAVIDGVIAIVFIVVL